MIISGARRIAIESTVACALIVFASGNPFISNYIPAEVLWPVLAVILALMSLRKGLVFYRSSILVLAVFALLTVVHLVMFGGATFTASIGFLIMLLGAFLASNVIDNFPRRYVDLMATLAAISLFFYIFRATGVIGPELFAGIPGAQLDNGWVHVGIFNFQKPAEAHRNSGPFWEPGAFAGYLVLTLAFTLKTRNGVRRWKILALVAALITTMSTTGYLASAGLLTLALVRSGKVKPLHVVSTIGALAIILVSFIVAYTEVPFLRDKIESQTYAAHEKLPNYEITRYGSLLYDLGFIAEKPLFGWGPSPSARDVVDRDYSEIAVGQGNAISGFAVKFGIFALTFYLFQLYRLGRSLLETVWKGLLFAIILSILLIGEQFLNFPLFWCLAMIPNGRNRQFLLGDLNLDRPSPGMHRRRGHEAETHR